MPFPDGFLQELKLRNPLEDVVSQYVTVKRAGSNRVACCPFHSEKTPSFTIYTQDPHFYCYGCGAGGDVITFIMRIENLDYMGAVEFLANRAGIPMPRGDFAGRTVDKKRFYEMNAKAAKFWHRNLFTPEGKKGLDYLTGRGLSISAIRHFGLGYASDRYDALSVYLLKEGYKPEEIREAFLGGISQKTNKPFDYFRNRAVFPVIGVSGRVIAFSGRFVGEMKEGDRKYFNTNDTPVYKKSRNVFALNFAKNSPEKYLVLCEGNMDAVSLHAHGVTNAVASLGTALTGDQCRLLARFTENVVLCYDADEAGKAATRKAIRLLTDTGIRVKVMDLSGKTPDGKEIKDPDDFIRALGKDAFLQRAEKAKGAFEYLFSELESRHDLSDLDGKNAFVKDAVALLSDLGSPVERELFYNRIRDLTGVSTAVLQAQVEKKSAKTRAEDEKKDLQQELREIRGFSSGKKDADVNPDRARFLSRATKEEAIIGILLLYREYLSDPAVREMLDPDLFSCELYARVLRELLRRSENGAEWEISSLNEVFTPDQIGELERLKRRRAEIGTNTPDILRELFLRLREETEKKKENSGPLTREWLEQLREKKQRKE